MSKSIYTPTKQFSEHHYYPIAYEMPEDAELSGWGVGGYISAELYKEKVKEIHFMVELILRNQELKWVIKKDVSL